MKLLKPEAVAEALSVSKATAYRLIESGALPAVLIRAGQRKKCWRVRQEILEKCVLDRETKGALATEPRRRRTAANLKCSHAAHAIIADSVSH